MVLDLSRMNQILSFDRETGIIRVQPGATIRDIWRHVVELGFWPPVQLAVNFVSVQCTSGESRRLA